MSQRSRVLPGFGLSLGFTLAYVSFYCAYSISRSLYQIIWNRMGRTMGNFNL